MAQVLIDEKNLINIADAIREKSNTTNTYSVIDMPEAINNIVSDQISLQEKTVNPSINTQVITPNSGYDGLSKVIVNAVNNDIDSNIKSGNIKKDVSILGVTGTLEEGIIPNGTLDITTNGIYDITEYANVDVNTPEPKEEQSKSITITENGSYNVIPDANKVLSNVNIITNVANNTNSLKTIGVAIQKSADEYVGYGFVHKSFFDLENALKDLTQTNDEFEYGIYSYGKITIYHTDIGDTIKNTIYCDVSITRFLYSLVFGTENEWEGLLIGYISVDKVAQMPEGMEDMAIILMQIDSTLIPNFVDSDNLYVRWDA